MREGVLCWPKNSLPSAASIGAAVRCRFRRLFRLTRSTPCGLKAAPATGRLVVSLPPPKKADGVKWKYKKLACFSASGIIKKTACFSVNKRKCDGKTSCFVCGETGCFLYACFYPIGFLGGGTGEPFFGQQRMVPPYYFPYYSRFPFHHVAASAASVFSASGETTNTMTVPLRCTRAFSSLGISSG